ncbi:MAG: single-stranded-DNA-specific exonuclease RecJ [Clostridiales bacterium]|nr:single-stranded-DNA-specific exonuclease RecJ [Clostridiales bacterium]
MERWFLKKDDESINKIAADYNISPVLAGICVHRGVRSPKEMEAFLYPSKEHLGDPSRLKDGRKAAELLAMHIEEKKRIRIIGDYDVDGIMSTFLLISALNMAGALADYRLPDRMKDGYGMNCNMIDEAKEAGVSLIITCDNGISAYGEVEYAKKKGMGVIVTDHHDIPYEETEEGRTYRIPPADCVVNPKQPDCPYPYKELCGASVAYQVLSLLNEIHPFCKDWYEHYLGFAAFATVCDVMPLSGENRTIVKLGLPMLSNTWNPGLMSLIELSGLSGQELTAYHLGFVLGPCLNAAGRLEVADEALNLLLSSKEQAREQAAALKELNEERKNLTEIYLEQAVAIAEEEEYKEDRVLVIYLPLCHESLAGIIAGRIRERYYKPCIILTDSKDGVKGSGRSIDGYSMYDELVKVKELFSRFGGHPMAAGMSLQCDSLDPEERKKKALNLRRRLNEKCTLTDEDLMRVVRIDACVPLSFCTLEEIEELYLARPFGKDNPEPLFVAKDCTLIAARCFGREKQYRNFDVRQKGSIGLYCFTLFHDVELFDAYIKEKFGEDGLDALYAGKGAELTLSLVFTAQVNEYRNQKKPQLLLKYYR